MANATIALPGQLNGTGDTKAGFMKIFAGEVLTAFEKTTVTMGRHLTRTIQNGKSASFPVIGRGKAKYLAPGANLDDQRSVIPHGEKTITIDGLLTADCLITDIDEAMLHYDVRAPYAAQLGESLAIGADGAVLAEGMKVARATENLTGLGAGGFIGVGAPAVTSEWGKLFLSALIAARGRMSRLRTPKGDRTVYVDVDVYAAALAALGPFAGNFIIPGTADSKEGAVIRWAGFDILEVPHFHDGGADSLHAADTKAVGLAMHSSAVGTVKLKDLAMESARRIEYQADMMVAKYAMGHGGLRPESAVLLDNTAPSAELLAATSAEYQAAMAAGAGS